MGMDLTKDCPHCEAKIGQLCTEDCRVNGANIKELNKILARLDLRLNKLKLSPIKYRYRQR